MSKEFLILTALSAGLVYMVFTAITGMGNVDVVPDFAALSAAPAPADFSAKFIPAK